MKTIFHVVDDHPKRIHIECSPTEWLIISKALREYGTNLSYSLYDTYKIKEMLETTPIVKQKNT